MNHDVPYDFTAGWISVSPPHTGIEALNQRQFNPNRKDAKLCLSLYIYFFRDFPISTSMQNRFSNATFDDTGEIHVKLSMKKPRVRPVEPLFPSCISSQNWGNWGIVINFNVSHEVGMTIPQYNAI